MADWFQLLQEDVPWSLYVMLFNGVSTLVQYVHCNRVAKCEICAVIVSLPKYYSIETTECILMKFGFECCESKPTLHEYQIRLCKVAFQVLTATAVFW